MRMLWTCIDMQIVDDLVTKACLREHTLHCSPYEFSRSLCEDLLRGRETLSAWITSVTNVNTISHLAAFEDNLLCVDDDDVVTAVNMRSESRFVLAAKDKSNS